MSQLSAFGLPETIIPETGRKSPRSSRSIFNWLVTSAHHACIEYTSRLWVRVSVVPDNTEETIVPGSEEMSAAQSKEDNDTIRCKA